MTTSGATSRPDTVDHRAARRFDPAETGHTALPGAFRIGDTLQPMKPEQPPRAAVSIRNVSPEIV
ncbi:hypothetical protein F8B43_3614 [Methylorubrum populi]|uniref:Uncharacterized protein n=1 Tax=Methylorubrum populi TaxID=223967 RepID=A0A833J5K4_9HYPH|nr:hypothetical protein F8B43_3614 [Methylorubrum populi]